MQKHYLRRLLEKDLTRGEFIGLVGVAIATVTGIAAFIKGLELYAATTNFQARESESGSRSGNVAVVGDTTASGGQAVQFGTTGGGGVSDATLQALIASVPPATAGPAPSGPTVGQAGQFDTSTLATNEIWDNFNGSTLDSRLWQFDSINQGGTQVYQSANLTLDGSGHAVMTCTRPASTIYSGRFTSRQKFAMKYGWCAASIKMPYSNNGVGRAWFPAFWLLLVGYNTSPYYAEFDLIEQFGDSTTYATHLYSKEGEDKASYKDVPVSHNSDASQGYHTYWMLWEEDRIRIGVDSLIMGDWRPTDFSAGTWEAHMQQPMYYIFNFAAAPSWLPAPQSSDFPAQMIVDWAWYKPLSAL